MNTKSIIKIKQTLYYASVFNKKKFFLQKNNISVDDLKKEHAKFIAMLFTSIALSVILIISLYYNYVGGFYFDKINSFVNLLGNDFTMQAQNYGTVSTSLNFDGNVINGMEYAQKVQVNLSSALDSCKLRAKAYISFVDYAQPVSIYGYTNWVLENDGYIYLNQEAQGGENIGVCMYIKIPEEILFDSTKSYVMTVIVEIIRADQVFVS